MANEGDSLICNFCKSLSEDLWNCEECKLKLCETCNNNIHTKIPATFSHTVLKQDETETANDDVISNFPCAVHADSSCFAICSHCSKCLCKDCLKKPNKDIYNERLETISEYQERINEDLPFFTKQLESLNTLEEKYEEKYIEMKDQIFERKEKMKRLATEEAIKLEKELDQLWSPTQEEMKKEKARLAKAERDLTSRKDIVERALSSQDHGNIISAADKVTEVLPEKILLAIREPPRILFSTMLATESITLGSITKVPKLKISKSMDCDVTDILTIFDDKTILGYDKNRRVLQQFVITLDGVYVSKTFGKPSNNTFTSITTSITNYSQDLLIRSLKKSKCNEREAGRQLKKTTFSVELFQLSRLSGGYTSTDNFSIGSSPITSLYFDNKAKIYVSYKSLSNFYSFKGIGIFNTNFEKLQQFEIGQINDKPFTNAKAIVTNTNDDICIVDLSRAEEPSKGEGRLLVFNNYMQFRWEFSGPDNETKEFFPEQIATSSKGYIFISDKTNNTVFMLSQNGDLLETLGETDGIQQPSGLAVDKKDQLFVGCPGKLHVVEIEDDYYVNEEIKEHSDVTDEEIQIANGDYDDDKPINFRGYELSRLP